MGSSLNKKKNLFVALSIDVFGHEPVVVAVLEPSDPFRELGLLDGGDHGLGNAEVGILAVQLGTRRHVSVVRHQVLNQRLAPLSSNKK